MIVTGLTLQIYLRQTRLIMILELNENDFFPKNETVMCCCGRYDVPVG